MSGSQESHFGVRIRARRPKRQIVYLSEAVTREGVEVDRASHGLAASLTGQSSRRIAPSVSIVVPVFREGKDCIPILENLIHQVGADAEVLLVVDFAGDPTVGALTELAKAHAQVRVLVNRFGNGPANAIRFGIDNSSETSDVIVVSTADGSDQAHQIPEMVELIRSSTAVIVAGSRYVRGGQIVAKRSVKGWFSEIGCRTFQLLTGCGTADATNSFKAYKAEFLEQYGIESRAGFEMGIEMVAKAHRAGQKVAELPTRWTDRHFGSSNFRVFAWLPSYIRWYLYGLGLGVAAVSRSRDELKTTLGGV